MSKNQRTLDNVATLIRGVSYKPEDLHSELDDNSVTLLKNNNVLDDGSITTEKVVYVDRSKVSPNQILKSGDIIVCASGSDSLVGKAAQFNMDGEYTFGAFCKVVRPHSINSRYSGFFFLSQKYRMDISSSAEGAIMKNLRNEHLLNQKLFYPDYGNQERIQAKLNKVLSIIRLRRSQLTLLDGIVKARFVEMFGDPKLNPHGYPVHQLSEHIQFLTSGSRGWAEYCVDDGSEWFITIKNVKDCHITTNNMQPVNAPDNAEAKRTRVQEGDLLISITADLGRTSVVTKDIADHGAYINQHLTCIRLNREVLEPLYVAYFMESPAGKEQFISKNQSAVKAGFNFNSINTLQLLVPPLTVQQEFLRFVTQVDKSKAVVQKALDEARLLFDSLMQRYFG